jgi:hypothetical protein
MKECEDDKYKKVNNEFRIGQGSDGGTYDLGRSESIQIRYSTYK